MTFNLIEINDRNIISIQPEALGIKAFSDVWNKDKSNNKEQALKELAFIYWSCNWNSMYYKGYPEDKVRIEIVKEAIFGKTDWKGDNIINEAIKEYKKLQDFNYPGLADLKTARKTLSTLKDFLDNLDPDERNNSGGLVLKPSDIYTAISKMGEALIAVDKMEKKIKEDLNLTDSRIKGGGKTGAFEDEDSLKY